MYLTKLWYLKNFDMLKIVREVNLEGLMNFTAMSHIKAYQDIYFPEQGSNHVYFVQEGHVKLSRLDDDGRPIVMEILRPGEILGKLALEGEDIPNEFAEASDDVTVCLMGRNNFETLLTHVPGLHFHLTKEGDHRLEEFEVKITDLVFKDVTRRIITFVARYGQNVVGSANLPVRVESPLSHGEIADLTGTSPEAVAMAMKELQDKKFIECSGQSLVFRDLAGLTKLAR